MKSTKDIEVIAVNVLKHVVCLDANSNIFDGVTAKELGKLAGYVIITCPKCGATAWCDVDCDLCSTMNNVLYEE